MGAPRHHQQGKEEYNFGTKIVNQEKMADSDSGGEAPVKRGRGRPKGTTKSGEPYVPKEKVPGRGRGRPKGGAAKAPQKPKAAAKNGGAGKGRGRPPKKRGAEEESNGAPAAKKAKGKRPNLNLRRRRMWRKLKHLKKMVQKEQLILTVKTIKRINLFVNLFLQITLHTL